MKGFAIPVSVLLNKKTTTDTAIDIVRGMDFVTVPELAHSSNECMVGESRPPAFCSVFFLAPAARDLLVTQIKVLTAGDI